MRKVLLFFALLSAVALQAQTGKWTNDKAHTRIGFEVKHAGLSFVSGRFGDFDITVDAAGKNYLGTKVDVTIQTKSISTGVEARDNHLRTADFFEVEKYPTMTFKSTKFVATSKKTGKIYGNLTIKGVTKPVVLNATLIAQMVSPMSKVMTAGFRLRGTVKRSDFGLGPKFLPALIGDNVNLIIDAEFSPAQ
ncbi:MAG: polyisoprenoid-binding protein [Prevotella sp.]|nr:polyisoprenoid-binding protein [Prevotella sp.]